MRSHSYPFCMLFGCVIVATMSFLASAPLEAQEAGKIPLLQMLQAETSGGGSSELQYEGASSCKKCHLPHDKAWKNTKHAKAFDVLKPGERAEAKTKFGLDPTKDYTKDSACLPCHTTGFGHAGGYAIPDPQDSKAVRAAAKLEGVGCEMCHGPGSEFNKVFKDIMTSGRKYKQDELFAVGLTRIDASTCTKCHNDKSPTYDADNPFNYEKMLEQGVHEHLPLKQREG